jgi:hypothetical protein
MKVWRALRVMLLGLVPGAALAYGNTGNSTVTSVEVDAQDGIIVVSGTWGNPDHCPDQTVVVIPMTGNYKDMEATLLAAYISGRSVSFWVNNCTWSGGSNQSPSAYAIVSN